MYYIYTAVYSIATYEVRGSMCASSQWIRHNRLIWLAWMQRGYVDKEQIASWLFQGRLVHLGILAMVHCGAILVECRVNEEGSK